ncbi:uncharacterized protein LOC135351270 isoform X2 [Halichondria panicea]|uniref:uncharacterized protein LOC135351270 isoform X2 n=1 Tax=Halichondria panicea TaxID=6063 RepID=UPI00312B8CBB
MDKKRIVIVYVCAILLSLSVGMSVEQFISTTATKSRSTTDAPADLVPVSDSLPGGTSYPLQEKQCDFGTSIDNQAAFPSHFAERNLLYIDTGNPATCSGRVAAWELCYQTSGLDSSTFDLLLLSQVSGGYRIHTSQIVTIEQPIFGEETIDVACVYVTAGENVSITHGDYIGFVCNDDIKTRLAPKIDTDALSSLRVFNLSSSTQRQRMANRPAVDVDYVPSDELKPVSDNLISQFRIVINKSEERTPSTQAPCRGPTTTWTPVFTAVVIASAVVIFVLFLMVCLMACCICQLKFKCCRCSKKKKVIHKITVEPITDQSMQYNDLYVPQDPSQIITGGERLRATIHGNPAYDTPKYFPATHNLSAMPSQDALSTATELSILEQYHSPKEATNKLTAYRPESTISLAGINPGVTSDMDFDMQDIFEESREIEHTYEMIQSGKIIR